MTNGNRTEEGRDTIGKEKETSRHDMGRLWDIKT